jgi:hypothetical protein
VANAGTVTVDFAAEVAKFNSQMKQVNDRVKSVESGFKKMAGVVDSALKLFSVGVAVNFIRSAAEAADTSAKLSDKLGISTERLAAFDLAAADAGVQTETLARIMTDAQRRLGDAAGGTGATADALKALGLNVRDLRQLSPDELFLKYADAIGQLSSKSDQFAIAQDLMGKSAQEAYALIAGGRQSIEAAAATVDKLGLALSRVDAAQIEEANDKLGLLARTSQAFGQQVAAALAPFVSEFVNRLTESGIAADQTRSKLDTFARAVFVTFEIIANAAKTFDAAVSGALFALVKPWERLFELLRRTAEFTAEFDAALGFDGLAERWTNLAQKIGQAESFLGAVAEQSSTRFKNAALDIKNFAQISAEADRIVSDSQARAEEAAARQRDLQAGLTGESILEKKQIELFQIEEFTQLHYDNMLQLQDDFLRITNATSDQLELEQFRFRYQQKLAIAEAAEQKLVEFKQKGYNAAVTLLTAYNGKFKTFAQAILVVQKAIAIKEAIMDTHAAVMKTYAKLGYPWGIPAAIAVAALGAARVAAIASETGLFGGGSGGGRAELGAPNNPVFTSNSDTNTETQQPGAQQNRQITVNFTGFATAGAARELAEALKDVIDNSDIHIIGPNSSQARELRGE